MCTPRKGFLYISHIIILAVIIELIMMLNFTIDDRPQLVVEPKKQNIMIRNGNERVTLECIAFGADITWERKSGMIPNKAMLREGGARLEIPNVRRDDDNDYRCIAENRNGQTMSKYVAVSVTGAAI